MDTKIKACLERIKLYLGNKILDTFVDIGGMSCAICCLNGTDAIMQKLHNSSNKKLREQLIKK